MSRRQRGYPWPSLAISPYHSSPPAGLQGYILCPHIVAVCKFVLVVLLLHIHMWGSTGVHRLWARPCFSSSVPRAVPSLPGDWEFVKLSVKMCMCASFVFNLIFKLIFRFVLKSVDIELYHEKECRWLWVVYFEYFTVNNNKLILWSSKSPATFYRTCCIKGKNVNVFQFQFRFTTTECKSKII